MLRILLFGGFEVFRGQTRVDELRASKSRELLAYLLLFPQRRHRRELLASLLWGDTSTAQSKKYLRQALWQLRAALASRDKDAPLAVGEDWVQLDPCAGLEVDVASFEQAFSWTRGTAGGDLDAAQAAALRTAVELYRGDLLEGCYWEWCLRERERLQGMHLAMLEKLMAWCEGQGCHEDGIAYGERALQCDAARESAHRELMRLFHAGGDRAGALRQYDRCTAALAEELQVEPNEETRALCDAIRTGRTPAHVLPANGAPAAPPLTEVLTRLSDLHQAVLDIDRRIQTEIAAVRTALQLQALETPRLSRRPPHALHLAERRPASANTADSGSVRRS